MGVLWAWMWAAVLVLWADAISALQDQPQLDSIMERLRNDQDDRRQQLENDLSLLDSFRGQEKRPPIHKPIINLGSTTSSTWGTPRPTSGVLKPPNPPGPTNPNLRPTDCAEIMLNGFTISGVYAIYPFTCTCSKPVLVWCDMETDGGGWTVILNRQSRYRQLDFNQTWAVYKNGFGSPFGEYYLGNDLLHKMTTSKSYAMRLDMEYPSGSVFYRHVPIVRFENEAKRYRVSTSGSSTGTASPYCLLFLSPYFSTYDRDSGDCARTSGGGWWYYSSSCYFNNPTVRRSHNSSTFSFNCYNRRYSLSMIQIKLRPSVCDDSIKVIELGSICHGCNQDQQVHT